MMGRLEGKRILLVEDEYYIASDLKRMVAAQGAVAVGPVADLEAGLALAKSETIDAAVLDVNLGEARSFLIAACLAQRSIPYIFLTGYNVWSLPEAYRGAPCVEKPYLDQNLLDRLERLITAEQPR